MEDIATAVEEVEEEVQSMVDTFWGRKCFLDVQCYYVFIDTTLLQVSTCDKGRGYTGMLQVRVHFLPI